MAYIDQGRSWAYTTIREHRGPTAIIGFALILALFASLLPRGAADAATSGPPASLTPANGIFFGEFSKPRGSESKQDAIVRVESNIGRKFAIDHQYYTWNTAIPTSYETWTASQGRIPFLNWKMPAPWSSVTNGSQDAWIGQRADAFKAFGSPVYLTIHHEPENDLSQYGSQAEFVAAFRHVVDVFRAHGVSNVGFVWTMMAWSFDSRSGESIPAWYPGNNWVDFIGADGYNWYPGRAGTSWAMFGTVFDQVNAFAVSQGKPWMAVEYGAQEDPADAGHKGEWFLDVLNTAQSWPALKGLIYFDTTKLYPWDVDSSSSSLAGYAALGNSPYLQPGAPPAPSPSRLLPPRRHPGRAPLLHPGRAPRLQRRPLPLPSPTAVPSSTVVPSPTSIAESHAGPVPDSTFSSPIPSTVVQWVRCCRRLVGRRRLGLRPRRQLGGSVALDATHTRGVGLSAKHTVGLRGNAYYGWGPTFAWAPTWYGRTYVWFDALPSGDVRLVRAQGSGALRFAIDVLRNGRLRLKDGGNVTTRHDEERHPHRRLGTRRMGCRSADGLDPGAVVQLTQPDHGDRDLDRGQRARQRFHRRGGDRSLRIAELLDGLLDRRPCDQHAGIRGAGPLASRIARDEPGGARLRALVRSRTGRGAACPEHVELAGEARDVGIVPLVVITQQVAQLERVPAQVVELPERHRTVIVSPLDEQRPLPIDGRPRGHPGRVRTPPILQ